MEMWRRVEEALFFFFENIYIEGKTINLLEYAGLPPFGSNQVLDLNKNDLSYYWKGSSHLHRTAANVVLLAVGYVLW